jgi:hypothetical protein
MWPYSLWFVCVWLQVRAKAKASSARAKAARARQRMLEVDEQMDAQMADD